MLFRLALRNAAAAAAFALPTLAFAEISIGDPYARTSSPKAPTGAAFMSIENKGNATDRLVSASSDIAKRVELHTHIDLGDGVMKMTEIEDGVSIGPGETYVMKRGGDHVMFMGLTQPLEQGKSVEVTLTFEQAGDIVVSIPVDNERQPSHGAGGHAHEHTN